MCASTSPNSRSRPPEPHHWHAPYPLDISAVVGTLSPIIDEIPDEALVAAAQQGDRDAMDALLRRHQDRLWAICRRLTGNDADAADALQDAMVLIVRRLATYDGRARFTTWAHRVATNACLDELRRRRRRPEPGLPEDRANREAAMDGPVHHLADTGPSVETTVTGAMTVDEALAQLPEKFRAPVVLRDLAGHDYAEIADILDLAPGTVRSRIARGRLRLAQLLPPDDLPPEDLPGDEFATAGTDPVPSDESPANESTRGPGTAHAGNQPAPARRPSTRP